MKIKSLIFSVLILLANSASANFLNNSLILKNNEDTLFNKMKKIEDEIWKTSLCIYSNSEVDRILLIDDKLNRLTNETRKLKEFYQSKVDEAVIEKNNYIINFLNSNIKDTNNFYNILLDLKSKFNFFISKNGIKSKLEFDCSSETKSFLENGNIFHFYDEIIDKNNKLMDVTENIFKFSKQRMYLDKFEDVKYLYSERNNFDLINVELYNLSRILNKTFSEVKDMIDIILETEENEE
nr:hypothetical protein GTC16762_24910 [Pigmentibacter ruber]